MKVSNYAMRAEGKVLIPGVVGHVTDYIEPPELVAERLITCATLVGREQMIAETDCGLGTRVSHPKIAWAKFQALADGAQLATSSSGLGARKSTGVSGWGGIM